jgi:hypothetical protein
MYDGVYSENRLNYSVMAAFIGFDGFYAFILRLVVFRTTMF